MVAVGSDAHRGAFGALLHGSTECGKWTFARDGATLCQLERSRWRRRCRCMSVRQARPQSLNALSHSMTASMAVFALLMTTGPTNNISTRHRTWQPRSSFRIRRTLYAKRSSPPASLYLRSAEASSAAVRAWRMVTRCPVSSISKGGSSIIGMQRSDVAEQNEARCCYCLIEFWNLTMP